MQHRRRQVVFQAAKRALMARQQLEREQAQQAIPAVKQ